jgi:phospholipid transport system substrate-binding protein
MAPGQPAETFDAPPVRTVAAAAILTLTWIAITSGFMVAPAAAAEPPAATAPVAGPQEVMADLTTRLIAALDRDSGAIRHNSDKVLPVIDGLLSPHFDMDYAARLVLGQYWRSATSEQRQQFAAALYRRLLHTYVGSVAEWTADRVRLLPLRSDPAALQVTVHTQVTNSRGAIVPVDYRLRETPAGWKIFDVIVDGASYMRNYHDDTDEQVARNGLDVTIAQLARSDISAPRPGAPSANPLSAH